MFDNDDSKFDNDQNFDDIDDFNQNSMVSGISKDLNQTFESMFDPFDNDNTGNMNPFSKRNRNTTVPNNKDNNDKNIEMRTSVPSNFNSNDTSRINKTSTSLEKKNSIVFTNEEKKFLSEFQNISKIYYL